MPEQKTLERARRDRRAGKASSTQAGEFVREARAPARYERMADKPAARGKAPAKRRKRVTTARTARKPAAKAAGKRPGTRKRKATRMWSARVMQRSNALDLESGVFKKRSARQVALSLKRSAEASRRRKSSPFRSAMSMLNFEINRAGRNLTAERRQVLNRAKLELRKAFHRPPAPRD
jgi:hypothetical protein